MPCFILLSKQDLNPSCFDPGRREKINLNFLFSNFFVVPQIVAHKTFWDIQKTSWGTTKKYENKNIS